MMEWTMALVATFLWVNTRWALLNRMQLLARSVKVQPGR
jgi:hypothetical protein